MYEVTCLDLDGNTINNFFQWDIDQKIMIKVKGCASDYLRIEPEVHFSNSKRDEALVVRSLRTGTLNNAANVMSKPSDDSDIITTLNSGDNIVYTEYVPDVENVGTAYETTREWCVFEYRNANRYIKQSNITRDMETITVSVPNLLLQEPYPLLVYVYLTDSDDVSSQRTVLYAEIPVRKRAKPHDYMYVENITRVTAESIKNEILESTKETRKDAKNTIGNSVTSVSQAETGAINKIDDAVKNAKQEIDNAMHGEEGGEKGFIPTGEALVVNAESIRKSTEDTYNNAVIYVDNIKSKFETEVKERINSNGVSLSVVNDNGNVNIAILIN